MFSLEFIMSKGPVSSWNLLRTITVVTEKGFVILTVFLVECRANPLLL